MNKAILPIEYLDTHMLCRWRFMLGDNIASERSGDEILEGILEKQDGNARILTKIKDTLYILAEARINNLDNGAQDIFVSLNSGDIYGNELSHRDFTRNMISEMAACRNCGSGCWWHRRCKARRMLHRSISRVYEKSSR